MFDPWEDPLYKWKKDNHDHILEEEQIRRTDKQILRDLAKEVAEIGARPERNIRAQLWRKHNKLERVKTMVLCFPQNLWNKLLPEKCLKISNPLLRSYEWHLREMIYRWQHLHDDFVTESVIKVPLGDN